jgi:pimeloyl-ACP methyl ester carboxylesterase
LLDRLDDMLEPTTRLLGGRAMWDEMKANAFGATDNEEEGAAHLAAEAIGGLYRDGKLDEVHLVGHSAGSIYHAHLAALLVKLGVPIASLTLWAPACTIELFDHFYRPLIVNGDIKAFNLFTLDDVTEKHDNCANIYHKSLLYLVSAAFETRFRIPFVQDAGEPLLGLERDIKADPALEAFVRTGRCKWFRAPGPNSGAQHHGSFDDDEKTLIGTLELITGTAPPKRDALAQAGRPPRPRPAAQQRQLRSRLNDAMQG